MDSLLKSKIKLWNIKVESYKAEVDKLTESIRKWKERLDDHQLTLKSVRDENLDLQNEVLKYKTESYDLKIDLKSLEDKIEEMRRGFHSREEELIRNHKETIEKAIRTGMCVKLTEL